MMTYTGAKTVKCFATSNPKANPWAENKVNKQQVATFRYHCRDWWKGSIAMVLAQSDNIFIYHRRLEDSQEWNMSKWKPTQAGSLLSGMLPFYQPQHIYNIQVIPHILGFITYKSFPTSSGFDLFQPLSSSHCYISSQNHNKLKDFVVVVFLIHHNSRTHISWRCFYF